MRIALIADHPAGTGIGRYSFELFGELRKSAGNETEMFFLRWSTRDSRPSPNEARVISLSGFWPIRSFGYARARLSSPLPKGFDVYHATHPMLAATSPDPEKVVVTVYDVLPIVFPSNFPLVFRTWFKYSLGKIARYPEIVATSSATKNDLVEATGLSPERVTVVPLGVSDRFSPGRPDLSQLELPKNKKILLHVGSEEKRKNVPFLFDVLAGILNKRDDVILVRVGGRRVESQTAIERLGLEDKVLYVNKLDEDDLISYYRAANLLVFPSIYEGFGLPPLEAMACGCPVVSSDASSLPEVVGKGGVLLPLVVDRWVSSICEILENPMIASEMVEKGLKQAANFSWDRVLQETLKVYSRLK